MLEFYWAYSTTYRDLMDLHRDPDRRTVADEVLGSARAAAGRGETIDLEPPLAPVVDPMEYGRRSSTAVDRRGCSDLDWQTLRKRRAGARRGISRLASCPKKPAPKTYGHLLMALFEDDIVEPEHLLQPTFVTDLIRSTSRRWRSSGWTISRFVERFELYLGGHGARQRLLGAQRPGGPGGPLPPAARGQAPGG